MIYYAFPQILTESTPAILRTRVGRNHRGKYLLAWCDFQFCNLTPAHAEEAMVVADAQEIRHPSARRMLHEFVTSVCGRCNTSPSDGYKRRRWPGKWERFSCVPLSTAVVKDSRGALSSFEAEVTSASRRTRTHVLPALVAMSVTCDKIVYLEELRRYVLNGLASRDVQ